MVVTEALRTALLVQARADRVALTATVVVRAVVSQAHRPVRTIRTATVIIMVRPEDAQETSIAIEMLRAAALTAVLRVAREALIVADRAVSTEALRVARVVSDLVQVEWAVPLQFLQLISHVSLLKKHLKAKNRYITARTKSSMMITSLVRRRRLKLQLL